MPTPAPSRRIVVALDGPASSGKTSVGAAVAARLGLRFLDTGLLYRAVTALALREGIAVGDPDGLVALVPRVALEDDGSGRLARVLVDGSDLTGEVHVAGVDAAVSAIAGVAKLRAALLERQRSIAEPGGIVVAGRDIGTVVLPGARLKLFLDASVDERAARRIGERGLDPDGPEAAAVRASLRARDEQDRGRPVAPLRPAGDARIVPTDGRSLDEVVALVEAAIRAAEPGPPGGDPGAVEAQDGAAGARARAAAGATERGSAPVAGERAPAAPTPEPRGATVGAPARRRTGLLELALRLDDPQTPLIRVVAAVSRALAGLVADVRIEGLERIPASGAAIIAANHASNADPVVMGAWFTKALRTRRLHWLGKQELFAWPVFGWMAAHGGIHPVDRATADVEAFRLASRILEQGSVLALFPEGTRSPDGALREAKDGLAALALRTGAPVIPVGLNGTDLVWRKGRRLPSPWPRRRVVVRIGEPVTAASLVHAGIERREQKGAVTRALMGRIAALLDERQRGVYAGEVDRAGSER